MCGILFFLTDSGELWELLRYAQVRSVSCSGWLTKAPELVRIKQPQLRNSFEKGNWARLD